MPPPTGHTRRACPVCETRTAEALTSIDIALPTGHPLSTPLVVVSCTACGTGFTDDPVAQQAYDDYDASDATYAEEGVTTSGGDLTTASIATPWAIANSRHGPTGSSRSSRPTPHRSTGGAVPGRC